MEWTCADETMKEKLRNSLCNRIVKVRGTDFSHHFFHDEITTVLPVNRKKVICGIISTKGNIIGYLLKSISRLHDPIGSRDQRALDLMYISE